MEQVNEWHKNLGWGMIGYHYFIEYDGTVKDGRPDWAVGAHAIGANYDALGICLAGNFEEALPSREQIVSLAATIEDIRRAYGNIPYIGHNEVDPVNYPTACPGALFPWNELNQLLRREAVVLNIDEAIAILQEKGIITSQASADYWKGAVPYYPYIDALIINMAKAIK